MQSVQTDASCVLVCLACVSDACALLVSRVCVAFPLSRLRRLGPRIEKLLAHELTPPLPFERLERLRCDKNGCEIIQNDGCLVVSVDKLFRWLLDAKPFESYCINIPASA